MPKTKKIAATIAAIAIAGSLAACSSQDSEMTAIEACDNFVSASKDFAYYTGDDPLENLNENLPKSIEAARQGQDIKSRSMSFWFNNLVKDYDSWNETRTDNPYGDPEKFDEVISSMTDVLAKCEDPIE